MESDTKGISCCFDEESARMLDDFRKEGLSDTAQVILSALSPREVSGSTVLEVGCGVGALTLELIKGGASSAVGIDLSPKMVEAARSLAGEVGLGGATTFVIGDGAKAQLHPSDMVILDAVVCCYPDAAALVDNSSAASRRFYALSLPDDRRPLTRLLKVFLPLQKLFFRRGSFRFFIHPADKIILRLNRKGFRLVHDTKAGRIWSVLIFAAPSAL